MPGTGWSGITGLFHLSVEVTQQEINKFRQDWRDTPAWKITDLQGDDKRVAQLFLEMGYIVPTNDIEFMPGYEWAYSSIFSSYSPLGRAEIAAEKERKRVIAQHKKLQKLAWRGELELENHWGS